MGSFFCSSIFFKQKETATPHKIRDCGNYISFYDTKSIDYSIIEATLPEPTVLPPSRSVGSEKGAFYCGFPAFYYKHYGSLSVFFIVFNFFRTKIEPRKLTTNTLLHYVRIKIFIKFFHNKFEIILIFSYLYISIMP